MRLKFGKCIFLLDLKSQKSSLENSDGDHQIILTLFKTLALIVRGIQRGYSDLKNIILTSEDPNLPFLYGKIIVKTRDYLTKENNF